MSIDKILSLLTVKKSSLINTFQYKLELETMRYDTSNEQFDWVKLFLINPKVDNSIERFPLKIFLPL